MFYVVLIEVFGAEPVASIIVYRMKHCWIRSYLINLPKYLNKDVDIHCHYNISFKGMKSFKYLHYPNNFP